MSEDLGRNTAAFSRTFSLTVTFTFYFSLLFFAMAVLLTYINVNGAAERHKRLKVFECLRTMHSKGGVSAHGPPAQIGPRASRFLFTRIVLGNSWTLRPI